MRTLYLKLLAFILFSGTTVQSQIIGGEGYIIDSGIEIGVSGPGGYEGADTYLGLPAVHHYRSNTQYFGFVADPQGTGWVNYDGDFFTPGTPENGWGLEIGGVNGTKYSNNCASPTQIPGSITYYGVNAGGCIQLDWEGGAATSGNDFDVKVTYFLSPGDLYYTTEVTFTNNTSSTIPEVYYYRNVDPDNNITINGGDYSTTNTIESQPAASCDKALVSATQSSPWSSYMGFAAIGDKFRVAHGGFSNRDASDLYTGTGFNSAQGSTVFADEAIALSYLMENIGPGESRTFKFVVILDATQADNAINNLFFLEYLGSLTGPAQPCTSAPVDTVTRCSGTPIPINVTGQAVTSFSWTWSPATGLNTTIGPNVLASPTSLTTYTATGTPINSCFTTQVTMSVCVQVTNGPDVQIISPTSPVSLCSPLDLSTIVTTDLNSIPNTFTAYYWNQVYNAFDTTGLITQTHVSPPDTIWVAIGDSSSGCLDIEPLILQDLPPFQFTVDITPASCAASDGSIEIINLTGATAPIDYVWSNGPTVALNDNIPVGTYTVTISDAAGCTLDSTINLPNNSTLTATGSYTPEDCESSNGTVTLNGANGAAPYEYDFGAGPQSNSTNTGLASGTYNYTVYDQNGCQFAISVTVTDTSTLELALVDTTAALCGALNGIAEVIATGGAGNYSYDLNSITQSGGTFTGLAPNTYTATVTSNTCTESISVVITDDQILNASVTASESDTCSLGVGSIEVTATDGTGTYSYTLLGNTNSSGDFDNLTTGNYNMDITSGTCSITLPVSVANHSSITGDFDNVTPDICSQGIGSISAIIDNGFPSGATYSLAPGGVNNSSGDFSGLSANTYTVTITLGSCSVNIDTTVANDPGNLSASASQIISEDCGNSNGAIFVQATGGTGSITYSINGGSGQSSNVFGALNDGTHTILVTDGQGCTFSFDTLVPELPMIVNIGPDVITCDPIQLASNVSGNYLWSTGTSDSTYLVATTGWYWLEVSNSECSDIDSVYIEFYERVDAIVPNIFTPNGDGFNDEFKPEFGEVDDYSLTIYNRWGQKIFETTDPTKGWNGDINGNPAVDGTYFFVVKFTDRCTGILTDEDGHVTLVAGDH